ncbi:MAG: SGNH/GDSL hydrolase family protein [Clostridia bacterium]|nr:SGNH/GDSL hydrolase family protein [Clostridia bacterium]
MKLEGLKINFLGDSITAGARVSCPENFFWNVLKRDCHLAEARGYGHGGTRITLETNQADKLDFYSRLHTMDDDADVVVIFGGTNDFGHGDAALGSMHDRNQHTFYGACHLLFSAAIEKYPDATIVVLTPLHRCNEDNIRGDGAKIANLAPLSSYVNIIREVAEYYSLPVLDLYRVSGIQPKVDIIREKYCPDGLHPNDAGHARIAQRLKGFLEAL